MFDAVDIGSNVANHVRRSVFLRDSLDCFLNGHWTFTSIVQRMSLKKEFGSTTLLVDGHWISLSLETG